MQPNVLVVDAGSPYWTLMDLVKAARARPGALNWGHAGNGTGTHLNAENSSPRRRSTSRKIPYKGTPEVIQGILGRLGGLLLGADLGRDSLHQERQGSPARGKYPRAH
jgi:tripartite-type tricarboxylate transporter receptor subunit TctC